MKGMSSFEELNDLGFSPLAMVGIWRGEALVLTMKAIVLWPVWLVKWVMAKASPASHNKRSRATPKRRSRKAAKMKRDITEGMVKKGRLNNKPKGVRPPPPKGQGTQPTDVQQLNVAITLLKEMINVWNVHGVIHKDSWYYERANAVIAQQATI